MGILEMLAGSPIQPPEIREIVREARRAAPPPPTFQQILFRTRPMPEEISYLTPEEQAFLMIEPTIEEHYGIDVIPRLKIDIMTEIEPEVIEEAPPEFKKFVEVKEKLKEELEKPVIPDIFGGIGGWFGDVFGDIGGFLGNIAPVALLGALAYVGIKVFRRR